MHSHSTIPNASGIYRIACIATGKFYIGSAANLRIRRLTHFSQLHRNIHHNSKLQNAWNKYGVDAFTFEVLELVLPISLTAREQYWLDKFKPFGKRGFNIDRMAGSRLGMKHTPETREKIRLAGLGNTYSLGIKASPEAIEKNRQRMIGNTYSLGYKHTAETRKKMSLSKQGHKHTPESRAKLQEAKRDKMKTLIAISPDGTEYLVHGVKAFCREHHLIPGELSRVARGERNHHRGWKAHYPE
jgi:group I intron endonuclease